MKKAYCSALAILMAAVLLVGCGRIGDSPRKDRDQDSKDKSSFLGQLIDSLKENDEKENDQNDFGNTEPDLVITVPMEEEVPATKPEIENITLKVWAPYEDMVDGGWMEIMQQKFADGHPEYNINWMNDICSEGDAGAMVSADPAAAADVYLFANDQLGTLINAAAISRLGGDFEAQVKNDNSQALVNTVTHTDGNIFGFPVANNTWFLYYNKNIFTEEDVKSLDTMLTKGNVAFPWGIGWYSGSFFFANGGECFGPTGTDAAAGIQFGADNGGYGAALKMVQLAANPNLKDDFSGLGYTGLIDGSVGAYFSGSWDYASLYEKLGDKLGAAQLPMVEIDGQQKQMQSFLGSKAVGVNPHTAYPVIAMKFAAFLASVESQKLRYEIRGVIPSAVELTKDPVIRSNPVALAEMNTAAYTSVVQPFIPEMSSYWTPVGNFGGLCAAGAINADNYKEQVDQMMAALNSPDW